MKLEASDEQHAVDLLDTAIARLFERVAREVDRRLEQVLRSLLEILARDRDGRAHATRLHHLRDRLARGQRALGFLGFQAQFGGDQVVVERVGRLGVLFLEPAREQLHHPLVPVGAAETVIAAGRDDTDVTAARLEAVRGGSR